MKISKAVSIRLGNLLKDKHMSLYRLQKITAIHINTLHDIMHEKNESVNLKTVLQIINGLDMTPAQFFDDPLFTSDDLEIF